MVLMTLLIEGFHAKKALLYHFLGQFSFLTKSSYFLQTDCNCCLSALQHMQKTQFSKQNLKSEFYKGTC